MSGKNAGWKFFRQNLLIHTHVEKTAGTTFVGGMTNLLGESHIHDMRSGKADAPKDMQPGAKARIWMLTGHFHYPTFSKFFARKPWFIACVRDPVERFFSYYRYVQAGPNHPGNARMKNKTFEQVVKEYLDDEHPSIINPMARTLTGNSATDLKTVLDHMNEHYALVIPQAKVNDALNTIYGLFGKSKEEDFWLNIGKPAKLDISEKSLERFQITNEIDYALVENVNEKYAGWEKTFAEKFSQAAASAES